MKSIKNILIFILLLLVISKSNIGENLNSLQAHNYASEFLSKINSKFNNKNHLYKRDYSEFVIENEILAYIFNLKPQGFIIVSTYCNASPVIGFSLYDNLPEGEILEKLPAYSIIKGIAYSHKYAEPIVGSIKKNTESTTDEIYGPYVNTLWGQVNCHNDLGQLVNVTNYYTPNHYAAGCVAISLSTLLHYYKWPVVGEGYHQYYDNWGSSTGWYDANFGETYYNWDLMLNSYNNQPSTDPQREAAGELAFHAAVALEMNFEYNGSTANVNEIPGTGSDNFRFYSFYKQENSTVFWPRLDKNMTEANPVILTVETNSGFGHSVVCDGLWIDNDDNDRYYHLNMGWWGSGNGWFTIQDNFNAGGYTTILGGVLDFIPKPILYNAEIAPDTNMFHLSWQFTQTITADAFEVQRRINSGSWETIAEDYQDTSLLIIIENIGDEYYFRVKAKVNDEFYPSSWSNTVQLVMTGSRKIHTQENCVSSFPNPFSDQLNISVTPSFYGEVLKIYSISGAIIHSQLIEFNNPELSLNTSNWHKGLYLIEMFSGKEKYSEKIIKN